MTLASKVGIGRQPALRIPEGLEALGRLQILEEGRGSSWILRIARDAQSLNVDDRHAGKLALSEDRHDHIADAAIGGLAVGRQPRAYRLADRQLSGDHQIDARIEFKRGHVLVR